MKKILTLLLALATLLSCFSLASCNLFQKDNNEVTTDNVQGEDINTEDPATALGLPDNLKFDATFSVLVWKSWVDEFGTTPYKDGDAIQQAIYERDQYINELLDIDSSTKESTETTSIVTILPTTCAIPF